MHDALYRRTGLTIKEAAMAAVIFALVLLLVDMGADSLNYNWQWYRVWKYIYTFEDGVFTPGLLLQGLWITLQITAISLVLAFLFGLTTAMLRLSDSFVGKAIARCYLESIRNTPLLIQIFFIYFVLGQVLDIDRFTAAVLALSLFEGAYASEVFRSGIASIDKGQWQAAHSLGLSTWHTYRYVVLPQAIRRILPPLASQAVALVKDSALVSTIAVLELTQQAQIIIAETFLTFEIWFVVAGIYLVVTITLSRLVALLEKRMGRGQAMYTEQGVE
ncbi:amino acid ABC transporter permease [Oceanidesulfovibrio indonesiensis]|uniref:Putative glutamine transport system permease protein GlnP n=2 Tax=Oceanidesulfovibrio indonesiensis TaxID=54767 RepID=A0A7M3MJ05_9BACT|nr:amino acid ABC transporter permease [Oceanidesulfovibrio indonesiensis]